MDRNYIAGWRAKVGRHRMNLVRSGSGCHMKAAAAAAAGKVDTGTQHKSVVVGDTGYHTGAEAGKAAAPHNQEAAHSRIAGSCLAAVPNKTRDFSRKEGEKWVSGVT
mgnify:CR=1 FL=1